MHFVTCWDNGHVGVLERLVSGTLVEKPGEDDGSCCMQTVMDRICFLLCWGLVCWLHFPILPF